MDTLQDTTTTTTDDGGGAKSEKDVTIDRASATTAEGNAGVLWCDLPNTSHVRSLDETNFRETVRENRCVLVFFHAKWCSACTPLKPVFAEVTSALDGPCCIAAAVDCTTEFQLAIENSIDLLPTIALFSDGECVDEYHGDRSAVDLQRFIHGATSALCEIPADVPATSAAAGPRPLSTEGPRKKAKAKKNKTKAAKKSPKKQRAAAVKKKKKNAAKPKLK